MRTITSFLLLAVPVLALGCGDDDDTPMTDAGPAGDAGSTIRCPATAPDRDGLMGPCCYRQSNAARPDAPEFRLAGIAISEPSTLANVVVQGLLQPAFDEERFNWLLRVGITGTDVTVETGFGNRNADGSFDFQMGGAPGGDPNRWDPITVMGSIAGENITAPGVPGIITLPVFDEMSMPTLELAMHNLSLDSMMMTEERTCVGRRVGNNYLTTEGAVTAYIVAADAQAIPIMAGPLDTTLCNFVADLDDSMMEDCATTPQAMWTVKPDSLCDDTACTYGACDQDTECNSWRIRAGFAAQGVEIAD